MTTVYTILEWSFVFILCLAGLIAWRAHQERKEREQYRKQLAREKQITLAQQQLTIDYHQAAVSFAQAMTQSLQAAVNTQANHKAKIADRELEVIYRFPQSARTQVTMEQPTQQQLAAPAVRQPTQRYLLDQLEENMLQVSPGVRTTDGQPVILSIPDAVHFKLIGSSGFGKSCLAAALLDQAIKLNSPDVLQVALLDLEHKTSRLFEHVPNVATVQAGRRKVDLVATNADEVAEHLGYLKREVDRRALLSEYDLQAEPTILMYIEEMLSLQYEVDEALLAQMLKDLSILAVRARKYNMFLLACAQTDYSTPELRTAQKQFRSRMAFAIDTTAARAAGFMNTELIKHNFVQPKEDRTFVLETPGLASLIVAPAFDVRAKVLALDSRSHRFNTVSQPLQDDFNTVSGSLVSHTEKLVKPDEEPDFTISEKAQDVEKYLKMGWGKVAIIEKVWNVKAGGSAAYKQAKSEYDAIIREIEQESEAQ